MLQQTQVPRVIPKYENWLEAFPTIQALAKASVSDVLTHWMGLGYNRRALYLKKCAEVIVKRGGWPQTEKELVTLPGIGPYTARALLSFAFGKDIAVVDTNIKKVILVEIERDKKDLSLKELEGIADAMLPKGKAYEWNQALMDYAAAVLKKEKIPIPKQSAYIGSDRYYRAKILKFLLVEKEISKKKLGAKLREDFSENMDPWLEKIVLSLQKDGLVTIMRDTIVLA